MRTAALAAAASTLMIAACGSTSTPSSTSNTPGPAGGPGPGGPGGPRRGAAGELVRIEGTTLTLSTPQGADQTVDTTATTTIARASNATVAAIVPGSCIVTGGRPDAGGAITAVLVRVSAKQNGACPTGRPGGGFGRAGATVVSGEVTAVQGTAVTVAPNGGGASVTITVPTTVRVTTSTAATFSDLAVNQCIQAAGPRDSSGAVQATSLMIVPPGPSGCFSGRRPGATSP